MLSKKVIQMKKENEFSKYKWSYLSMIVLGYNLNAVGIKTEELFLLKGNLWGVETVTAEFAETEHC